MSGFAAQTNTACPSVFADTTLLKDALKVVRSTGKPFSFTFSRSVY